MGLAACATKHRLPSAFISREFVEAGGLMSYGPNVPDGFRRAAGQVAKILKDTKSADLPFEQPTRFQLTVNLKTARTLGIDDVRAVHFAFSGEDAAKIRREWGDAATWLPLEVDEAPYRDIGQPLLRYLRGVTMEQDAEVLVVMPELVVRGFGRLLHNQRALYIKRLLLFEPGVILASVPYQLLR